MNVFDYLMIKKASKKDRKTDALKKKYEAYTPSLPFNIANDDRFFGYMTHNDNDNDPDGAIDPKAMTFNIGTDGFVPVDLGDKFLSGAWHRSKYNINPAGNLAGGDRVSTPTGLMYDELRNRGYGRHELKNISLRTLGLTGDKDFDIADSIDYFKGRPSLNVWVDDAGNLVDRSKGIVRGRHIGNALGTVAGGIGGYYGGNYLANKLGWGGPKATKLKRFGGDVLRFGSAVIGADLGGKYGNLAGEAVGGWIDPQKGTKIKAYTDNTNGRMLENITNN